MISKLKRAVRSARIISLVCLVPEDFEWKRLMLWKAIWQDLIECILSCMQVLHKNRKIQYFSTNFLPVKVVHATASIQCQITTFISFCNFPHVRFDAIDLILDSLKLWGQRNKQMSQSSKMPRHAPYSADTAIRTRTSTTKVSFCHPDVILQWIQKEVVVLGWSIVEVEVFEVGWKGQRSQKGNTTVNLTSSSMSEAVF